MHSVTLLRTLEFDFPNSETRGCGKLLFGQSERDYAPFLGLRLTKLIFRSADQLGYGPLVGCWVVLLGIMPTLAQIEYHERLGAIYGTHEYQVDGVCANFERMFNGDRRKKGSKDIGSASVAGKLAVEEAASDMVCRRLEGYELSWNLKLKDSGYLLDEVER